MVLQAGFSSIRRNPPLNTVPDKAALWLLGLVTARAALQSLDCRGYVQIFIGEFFVEHS